MKYRIIKLKIMKIFNELFKSKKEEKRYWMYMAFRYKKEIPLRPYIFRFFETEDELYIFHDELKKKDISIYPEFTEFMKGDMIFYNLEEKTK